MYVHVCTINNFYQNFCWFNLSKIILSNTNNKNVHTTLPLFLGPVGDSVGDSVAVVLQLSTESLPIVKVGPRVGQLHLCLRVIALQPIIVFL